MSTLTSWVTSVKIRRPRFHLLDYLRVFLHSLLTPLLVFTPINITHISNASSFAVCSSELPFKILSFLLSLFICTVATTGDVITIRRSNRLIYLIYLLSFPLLSLFLLNKKATKFQGFVRLFFFSYIYSACYVLL